MVATIILILSISLTNLRFASTREATRHVAATLNNLAGLLEATNRLDEAEPMYRRAESSPYRGDMD